MYVKALEGAFNQEKDLVGAFSVIILIIQLRRLIVCSTTRDRARTLTLARTAAARTRAGIHQVLCFQIHQILNCSPRPRLLEAGGWSCDMCRGCGCVTSSVASVTCHVVLMVMAGIGLKLSCFSLYYNSDTFFKCPSVRNLFVSTGYLLDISMATL